MLPAAYNSDGALNSVCHIASSNGMKMDPVYLPIGLRMGGKEYLELVLKAHMLPWIQTHF